MIGAVLDGLRPRLAAETADAASRVRAARLLTKLEQPLAPAQADVLRMLAVDPAVDPIPVARAGWDLIAAAGRLPTADEAGAAALESDFLALALLAETSVAHPQAERALSGMRRWLLLAGRAGDFPRATAAFVAQARRNGGAWPFDAEETARLTPAEPLADAYRPPRPIPKAAGAFGSPVVEAIAEHYEEWPYPVWERVMDPGDEDLASLLASLGPGAPTLPESPEILVAGCGGGRETMLIALRAPRARITAVDLSSASLAYAAERCARLGNVTFEQRDLHRVGELGRTFDLISCSGVIHHLPDPEAGWRALVEVLKPGGVISVMVYSKLARMRVKAARRRIADLLDRPIDGDLMREARARLLTDPPHPLAYADDFASLGGLRDLLLHHHEDNFDVPRVRRGVEALGLEFLGFQLPGGERRARYRADNPHDPWFRDYDAWAAAEWREPDLFAGMYRFWCRKPA